MGVQRWLRIYMCERELEFERINADVASISKTLPNGTGSRSDAPPRLGREYCRRRGIRAADTRFVPIISLATAIFFVSLL